MSSGVQANGRLLVVVKVVIVAVAVLAVTTTVAVVILHLCFRPGYVSEGWDMVMLFIIGICNYILPSSST